LFGYAGEAIAIVGILGRFGQIVADEIGTTE
jgi:hypothetical protein